MRIEKWTVRAKGDSANVEVRVWLTLANSDARATRYAVAADPLEALMMALMTAATFVTDWELNYAQPPDISHANGCYIVAVDLGKDVGKFGQALFGAGRSSHESMMMAIINAFLAALEDLQRKIK